MKPVAFDYERASDVASATKQLAAADGSGKILAGGQSLGPMLNLRLAQPQLLVDIRGIEELRQVSDTADSLTLGACVTHSAIEDDANSDPTRSFMRFVARDIAYRAVRNRGTIGGSLCHADPAADWLTALLALSAIVLVQGVEGTREIPAQDFVEGAFSTALAEDEIVTSIRIPRLSTAACWSYYKFSRKPGEFAEAIAAFVVDPARAVCRAVIGATTGVPHVVAEASALTRGFNEKAALQWVSDAGVGDEPYARQMHVVALKRAAAALQS